MARKRKGSKHPVQIYGYRGSLEELGHEIGQMRYDAGLSILHAWSLQVYADINADANKDRPKHRRQLANLYIALAEARKQMQIVWSGCRAHMSDETSEAPEIQEGQIHGY